MTVEQLQLSQQRAVVALNHMKEELGDILATLRVLLLEAAERDAIFLSQPRGNGRDSDAENPGG